jgi:hypothetical protein
MSSRYVKVLSFCAAGLVAGILSTTAGAATAPGREWRETHPRRAEVNARLAHQSARIHEEVREGDLSRQQGRSLLQQDRSIRQQERQMAAGQGGHITKAQQRQLNREENAVSKQIPR